jgi:hypothetical protein
MEFYDVLLHQMYVFQMTDWLFVPIIIHPGLIRIIPLVALNP